MHCEEPCGTSGASGRLCEPSSAGTGQTIVKGKQKTVPNSNAPHGPPCAASASLLPATSFLQDKSPREGAAPKENEKVSSVRFKATSQCCKESFIRQGSLPLLQSKDAGGSFLKAAIEDERGRGGSHHRLQRGRLSHTARRGREAAPEATRDSTAQKSPATLFLYRARTKRSDRAEAEAGRGERQRCGGAVWPLPGGRASPRQGSAGGSSSALACKGPPSANSVQQNPIKTPQPLLCQ